MERGLEDMSSILKVEDLVKYYGEGENQVRAVDHTSLQIERGKFTAIVGRSGSGKSTFLRCLNLLEKPEEGEITVNGQQLLDPKLDVDKFRENVGMVFQHFNLFPHMTILDNMTLAPMKVKGVSKEDAEKKALELLARVGLADRANAYPIQLSGGQKQRVAIAGVVAMEPKCIVFDEPTAMLDPNGRKEVIATAHELNKKKGVTIILITHYMEEVVGADHVYVMEKGKVVMDGTPREIFSRVDELKEHRLDVPQVTLVADELKKAGLDIPDGILTREELVNALVALKNR